VDYSVKVVRKNIKNCYIRVVSCSEVVLSVPLFTSQNHIDYMLKKRASWIEKKLNYFNLMGNQSNNNRVLYLGKSYNVELVKSDEQKVDICSNSIIVYLKDEKDKDELLERWYKKEASRVLDDLTKYYLGITSKSIDKLRIKKMKSRWGSCNHIKRYINLNQCLIKKPIEFIEYVVLHEIAHLTHPNHSKEFYNYIEKFMPDWSERRKF